MLFFPRALQTADIGVQKLVSDIRHVRNSPSTRRKMLSSGKFALAWIVVNNIAGGRYICLRYGYLRAILHIDQFSLVAGLAAHLSPVNLLTLCADSPTTDPPPADQPLIQRLLSGWPGSDRRFWQKNDVLPYKVGYAWGFWGCFGRKKRDLEKK